MLFAGHVTLSNGSWVPGGTVVLSRNLTLTTGAFLLSCPTFCC